MDSHRCDHYARRFGARLSRRGLTSALAGGFTTLALNANARATHGSARETNVICQNLGTACGDTSKCQCRLDKSSQQTCQNIVDPPDRRAFIPCQTNVNCPAGQVCDAADSVCMSTCDTPPPPGPPPSNDTSCQNLGTACGNTAICQCRLDKSSAQICQNIAIPPNGIEFESCETNDDCAAGLVCDAVDGLCVSTCTR